jgi:NAD(P)H dehydrogenase (quinone)
MSTSAPGLIAVTGATGVIGGRVATLLAERGVPQRLVVRDPGRAQQLDRAETAVASYDEPDAMRAAFAGADTLLLVSAAEHPDRVRQHIAAVDAAAEAGVRRVIYTSFLGAAAEATFTLARHHWVTEQRLRDSGMTFTFLRDSLYLDFLPFMAGEAGVIRGPAGDGRFAPVARADVSDVATAVLLDGSGAHDGQTYDVTGSTLRTMTEWAAELSAAAGREVRYQEETVEEAWVSRAVYGAPEWEVEGWITSYVAVATGELAVATDVVQRVAGHPPRELIDLVGPDAAGASTSR